MLVEMLEMRQLMSLTPTADEQYMLELINRARANPSAEAAAFGIALNEGLPAGTISTAAKQPLAFNTDLIASARGHSQFMLDNQLFQHNGPGNTDPGTRMAQAGYAFTGNSGWGENIAERGSSGTINNDSFTAQEHQDLFVDASEPGRGHRTNIEDPSFKEVGVGIVTGEFQGFNSLLTTQDFAFSGSTSFLTGVAYTDAVKANHFYDPGEGLGNITITATNTQTNSVLTTTTWSSGGYTLALPAATYRISASGVGLGASGHSGTVSGGTVTIGNLNVEADFTPSTSGGNDSAPPTAVLAAKNLHAISSGYLFTITYTDANGINPSIFDKNDLIITGPNGYRGKGTVVAVKSTAGGTIQKVTYKLPPPVKNWTASNDGVYHIYVRANQVGDVSGHLMPQTFLGYFKIQI
jgi:serralysin